MSKKDLKRYEIIKRLIHNDINGTDAAKLLKLSTRQIRRLKSKVKRFGAKGIIHGNRGMPSHNCIPEKEQNKIIELLHKHYYDFKPTLASEKLSELHDIVRDSKTIRQIMIKEGLWKPRAKRKKQQHRAWRERKANYGEMSQFDGSYEYWFEDRAPKCCLLASIDDATGNIIKAKFVEDEGVFSVFSFWKDYLLKHGKPQSIYLDKFSTYKMTQRVALENHDTQTQFQRAMTELQIEPISAHSPEAKGRVERLFNTLQDRLIKELRLVNVSNREEANKFLEQTFIPFFNKKFGVHPRNKINLHRKLSQKEEKQLDSIFSRHTERTVQNDFTLSFNNQWYQLTNDQTATICKKDKVIMEEHLDGQIKIRFKSKYLNYKLLPERPKRTKDTPWVIAKTSTHKPPQNHPWRRFQIPPNSLNMSAK